MGRPARPWFRFYVEAMRDPKMRRLAPAERWLWVAILSAARESPLPGVLMVSESIPYSWDDLADYAGMKLRDVEQGTDRMHDLGMLEFDGGAWRVAKWGDRQYESDTSTDRTSKWRHKQQGCDGETTAVVTPPDTETDTETDGGAQHAPTPPPSEPKSKPNRGTRIPIPFVVSDANREWAEREIPGFDWDREGPKFVDYWRSKSRDATKLDWDATWRNWMRRAAEGGFR